MKYFSVKKFREMGLLAELNRTFFHPLGMALEVNVDPETGEETFGQIWDSTDDPEEFLYSDKIFPYEKIKKAQDYMYEKHTIRLDELGYIYQEVKPSLEG